MIFINQIEPTNNVEHVQDLVERIEEDKRIKDQFFIEVFWERMVWEVYGSFLDGVPSRNRTCN